VLPAGLNKFFFATSGTEANEAAFKIARMFTGKTKIISRYRSYHGSTMARLRPRAIRAAGLWNRAARARLHLRAGDQLLRLPDQAHLSKLQHRLRRLHRAHDRNESDVAAVILEPVVGTNGVLVPPPEYFPRCAKSATATACC
jgi:taurine--2-oxoglutarate transaminase